MKNVDPKSNFKRIGSLLCAFLIVFVGVFGFFAMPAFATGYPFDNSFPFGFLFNSDLPLSDMEDVSFSLTFTASSTSYQYILVRESGIYYSRDSSIDNALRVYDPSSNTPWGLGFNRYIVVTSVDSFAYSQIFAFFEQYGAFYYFSGRYELRPEPGYRFLSSLSESLQFYSNGQLFTGFYSEVQQVNGVSGQVVGYLTSDNQKVPVLTYQSLNSGGYTIYSIDERYSVINFEQRYVPSDSLPALAIYDYFVPIKPTFLDRLGTGFTAAIGWLGDFFTSLFTGNLVLAFVLVSVGFGLALLSFGWRWIRRCLWGY